MPNESRICRICTRVLILKKEEECCCPICRSHRSEMYCWTQKLKSEDYGVDKYRVLFFFLAAWDLPNITTLSFIQTYFLDTSEVFPLTTKCVRRIPFLYLSVRRITFLCKASTPCSPKPKSFSVFPSRELSSHTDDELITVLSFKVIQPILLRSKVTVLKSCQFNPSSFPLRWQCWIGQRDLVTPCQRNWTRCHVANDGNC